MKTRKFLGMAVMAMVVAVGCAPGAEVGDDTGTDELLTLRAAANLHRAPHGDASRYPVVLAHGFDASPTNRWGFYGVAEALRADGHLVFVATVPPYDSPAVRARHLARAVDAARASARSAKVNLVAHSMGGLDARELISALGYGDRVASL